MASYSPERLSRLRWYLGVVGIIGGFSQAVNLTTPDRTMVDIALAIAGCGIFGAYFLCTIFFQKAGTSGVLLRVLYAAISWITCVGISLAFQRNTQMLIPLVLFVALPCIGAILITLEWRDSRAQKS